MGNQVCNIAFKFQLTVHIKRQKI